MSRFLWFTVYTAAVTDRTFLGNCSAFWCTLPRTTSISAQNQSITLLRGLVKPVLTYI